MTDQPMPIDMAEDAKTSMDVAGLGLEVAISGLTLFVLETGRAILVNPISGMTGMMARSQGEPIPEPILSPEENPILFPFLSSLGDFTDGYFFIMLGNNILKFAVPSIPSLYRTAISTTAVSSLVAAYEMGFLNSTTPDPWDIPAGVVGSLLSSGLHLFLDYQGDRMAEMAREQQARYKSPSTE